MEKTCANCLFEYACEWPQEMICDDWKPEPGGEEDGKKIEAVPSV